jgi:polysaccharide pyruvyl transferase WcaK-like protein
VETVTRRLVADGRHVLLVPTFRPDAAMQASLASEVGAGVQALPWGLGVEETMHKLADCELIVAHKLHAAVLSAAAGVPTVALEYRPKCRDFQESIGRGRYVMRTDQMDLDLLMAWVADITERRHEHTTAMVSEVNALRARMREASARVREWAR